MFTVVRPDYILFREVERKEKKSQLRFTAFYMRVIQSEQELYTNYVYSSSADN